MRVAFLMFALLASAAATDQNDWVIYKSGNDFLRICDDGSSYRRGLSAEANSMKELVCIYWLTGVRNGVEVEDKFRPKHTPTKEEEARDRATVDSLLKSGLKPAFEMPDTDLCIPEAVDITQIKLVVIKYMKDHPGALTTHAGYLAIAAMKAQWPCS